MGSFLIMGVVGLAGDGAEVIAKKSVNGALRHLDFINIFQSLLYLTGSRND